MTGGPGLDREDSSSNRRWRRAAEGQWKRALAGKIKGEEEQVVQLSSGLVSGTPARVDPDSDLVSGLGRPSQPGPCLASVSRPPPTRRRATRPDSVAGARARLAWPCLGSPDSESGRVLPVSWATAACTSGRLASGSPPTRWRPSQPSSIDDDLISAESVRALFWVTVTVP